MIDRGISASVGRNAANRRDDVVTVQRLLIARGFVSLGDADGDCRIPTVDAITAYQADFLRKPDGVVDPDGRTWRNLAATYTGDDPVMAELDASRLTRPVPRPDAGSVNIGLECAGNSYMLQKLGAPCSSGYTTLCQPPTNPRLRRNLVTDTVGPFRVTGLVPAVLSMKSVMNDIRSEQPAVYRALGSAGMLCCRLVRGSNTSISSHSWGTAIDLTINGVLDVYGNDTVQYGLTLIAPIFNRHGWFWGATFRKEDGMHFEGSQRLIDEWAAQLA